MFWIAKSGKGFPSGGGAGKPPSGYLVAKPCKLNKTLPSMRLFACSARRKFC